MKSRSGVQLGCGNLPHLFGWGQPDYWGVTEGRKSPTSNTLWSHRALVASLPQGRETGKRKVLWGAKPHLKWVHGTSVVWSLLGAPKIHNFVIGVREFFQWNVTSVGGIFQISNKSNQHLSFQAVCTTLTYTIKFDALGTWWKDPTHCSNRSERGCPEKHWASPSFQPNREYNAINRLGATEAARKPPSPPNPVFSLPLDLEARKH